MEIRCKGCGRLTLARAEPVYEDFRKVAETFVCSGCGHRYPSREQTPFVDADGRPRVFSDADKPAAVKVFRSDERRRSCAWCRHFIVNPFCQRCGLSNREVEATDVCARFSAKPDQPAESGARNAGTAVSRFDALFQNEAPVAPAAAVAQKEPTVVNPAIVEAPAVQPVGEGAPQAAPGKKPAAGGAKRARKKSPAKAPAKAPARKPRQQSAK